MQSYLGVLEDFVFFLRQFPDHIGSITFATVVWLAIVVHLFITGHATLGANGNSDDIGCGDIRVWRIFVIFGGPAGLGFGLPYYLAMNYFGFNGWFREYWTGFVYVQFATSLVESLILFVYVLVSSRNNKPWRFFKSHLKGCGWISATSPFGWVLYLIQQFLPNSLKAVTWFLRDIETIVTFVSNILIGPTLAVCLVSSVLHQRFIIPKLVWIDVDHRKDEDSN